MLGESFELEGGILAGPLERLKLIYIYVKF